MDYYNEYTKNIAEGTYNGMKYEIIDAKLLGEGKNMDIGIEYFVYDLDTYSVNQVVELESYLGTLLTNNLKHAILNDKKEDGNQI